MGGAIGMMFVLLKIELFLPIVGVVFLAEAMSVLLQISGFKITKRLSKDGAGRRLFLRAPLHHHYQMKWKDRFDSNQALNSKIIWRFHLVSILALILGMPHLLQGAMRACPGRLPDRHSIGRPTSRTAVQLSASASSSPSSSPNTGR